MASPARVSRPLSALRAAVIANTRHRRRVRVSRPRTGIDRRSSLPRQPDAFPGPPARSAPGPLFAFTNPIN